MWSAVRLVAVMPVVSATTTLPLPSMPPTCCTAPSPAASVPLLAMAGRIRGCIPSCRAEMVPSSSSVACVATVTETPESTVDAPMTFNRSMPAFMPSPTVIGPVKLLPPPASVTVPAPEVESPPVTVTGARIVWLPAVTAIVAAPIPLLT